MRLEWRTASPMGATSSAHSEESSDSEEVIIEHLVLREEDRMALACLTGWDVDEVDALHGLFSDAVVSTASASSDFGGGGSDFADLTEHGFASIFMDELPCPDEENLVFLLQNALRVFS